MFIHFSQLIIKITFMKTKTNLLKNNGTENKKRKLQINKMYKNNQKLLIFLKKIN